MTYKNERLNIHKLAMATCLLGFGVFILYRFHCDWLAYEEYEYEDDPDPEKEPKE